jgi:rubrerythrin
MSRLNANIVRSMILLERKVGLLYSLFEKKYPQDCAFWKQLVVEEVNHAGLLETLLEYIIDSKDIHKILLEVDEDSVLAINDKLENIIATFNDTAFSRENALLVALQIEQSAGEAHFQRVSAATDASVPVSIFQSLVGDDRDHANRINKYIHDLEKN